MCISMFYYSRAGHKKPDCMNVLPEMFTLIIVTGWRAGTRPGRSHLGGFYGVKNK